MLDLRPSASSDLLLRTSLVCSDCSPVGGPTLAVLFVDDANENPERILNGDNMLRTVLSSVAASFAVVSLASAQMSDRDRSTLVDQIDTRLKATTWTTIARVDITPSGVVVYSVDQAHSGRYGQSTYRFHLRADFNPRQTF